MLATKLPLHDDSVVGIIMWRIKYPIPDASANSVHQALSPAKKARPACTIRVIVILIRIHVYAWGILKYRYMYKYIFIHFSGS